MNPAVTDNTDFVFQVGYFDGTQDKSNDNAGADLDSDGYILTVGLRSMLTDQLEVSGYVDSVSGTWDLDTGDEDFTDIIMRVGGVYYFTDNLGLSIEYEDGDDSAATFGARWSF